MTDIHKNLTAYMMGVNASFLKFSNPRQSCKRFLNYER